MIKKAIRNKLIITLVGAALLTGVLFEAHTYTTTPKYIANHELKAYNPSTSERIILESKTRNPDKRERARDLQQILSRAPFQKSDIEKVEATKAVELGYISPEKNSHLSRQVERLGRNSIDHMFAFINSPYLTKDKLHFYSPKTAKEIKKESRELNVYIVSKVGTINETTYKLSLKTHKPAYTVIDCEQTSAGENEMKFEVEAKQRGFTLKQSEFFTPLFYSTSSERISKVETLAIETLHHALRPYTQKHFGAEIENIDRTNKDLNNAINKWKDREETITHSIAILWIQQYNQDRQLGLSQEEFEKRFSWYREASCYRYVKELARELPQISIKKAIELYATNPEELFRGLEKK